MPEYSFKKVLVLWRSENVDVPNLGEKRNGHVSMMTKEDWLEILQKGSVQP